MRISEQINPDNAGIDKKKTGEILKIINDNDKQVASAVEKVLPEIEKAVDLIVARLKKGGRLFYIGAGTSGRLGVADAAECPPTFGVAHEKVTAIMCGGRGAVFKAREGKEDMTAMGGRDLLRNGLTRKDAVVGVSSSGRTPYVLGALKKAKEKGAAAIALICNPEGSVCEYADVAIKVVTGPEVIAGSTRMKAGTAQKMILNMISTTTMIRLGKVTGNMMTDMQISCGKLVERAKYMIMESSGVDENTAAKLLEKNNNNVKKAIDEAIKIKA